MLKGVVIMKNINIQKQNSLIYSHLTINQQQYDNNEDHVKLIQFRLNLFKEVVETGIIKVKNYLLQYIKQNKNNYKENNELLHIVQDFLRSEEEFKIHGISTLNKISNEIELKNVNIDIYKELTRIINNHIKIANELINKEIDLLRVEYISNYIREIGTYIGLDLNVEKIPGLKNIEITLNVKKKETLIIKDLYYLHKKDIA
ncbi:hypothetical protein CD30_09015 [Ureibacillus massiliensis 4400831 = CIP 108448 = CCUG 49529]|uniref:Uncharacterized protein n=1 Tax=Ureibacillus massiliensis 4400831 = CIP 108448 = CCUG 49529 TaxID=1211035 RepID=A0A0A3J1R0_9BACL|nr:hypothetical protein [Ureibacillus massiliensis]KGR90846.1 hypothetical protein CD30_09015 [Ureibacillus massiliensis 4400831 = CIP 108448 = CCUG 49529]